MKKIAIKDFLKNILLCSKVWIFIFCVLFKPSPELRKVITTVAMDSNIEEGNLHPNRDGVWIAIREKDRRSDLSQ